MAYVKLLDLVRKLDSGTIELPLMQRDFVWPASKVIDLLNSLCKVWPIGVLYIWRTPTRQLKREATINKQVGSKITEPFWGYLLDGQQRLTSLSRALEDKLGDNLATRAFFDVRKDKFVMGKRTRTIEKRIAKDDPTLVELSELPPRLRRHLLSGSRPFGPSFPSSSTRVLSRTLLPMRLCIATV
jgi:hypothetical protein